MLRLIISEATKALKTFASSANSALTGAVTTNIFLSLFLGVSMKKMWMMITTLQIIVHLPMLKILLPANTIMCFKTIVDISNMNIIPKAWINAALGVFISNSGSDEEVKGNFKQMDIFWNLYLLLFFQS